jgi:preprotein translocase subunit SecG
MQTVLIVIHLLVVIALVGAVLLQRSEGGVLGTGGGGGGFMTGRGQANALSRATAILGDAVLRHRAGDVDPGELGPRAAIADQQRPGLDLRRARDCAYACDPGEPARPAQADAEPERGRARPTGSARSPGGAGRAEVG